MARCVYSLCQSANTKLIERTCRIIYNNENIVDCHISELWLCNNCGNAFKPGAEKIAPWHLRFKGKRKISKSEIIRELFGKSGVRGREE